MSLNISKTSNGADFFAVLTDAGEVYTSGKNNYGQLGIGNLIDHEELQLVNFPLVSSLQITPSTLGIRTTIISEASSGATAYSFLPPITVPATSSITAYNTLPAPTLISATSSIVNNEYLAPILVPGGTTVTNYTFLAPSIVPAASSVSVHKSLSAGEVYHNIIISSASALGHPGPMILTYEPVTGNGSNSAMNYHYTDAYPVGTTGYNIEIIPAAASSVTSYELVTSDLYTPTWTWIIDTFHNSLVVNTLLAPYMVSSASSMALHKLIGLGEVGHDLIISSVSAVGQQGPMELIGYVPVTGDGASISATFIYNYYESYPVPVTGYNIHIDHAPPGPPITSYIPILGSPTGTLATLTETTEDHYVGSTGYDITVSSASGSYMPTTSYVPITGDALIGTSAMIHQRGHSIPYTFLAPTIVPSVSSSTFHKSLSAGEVYHDVIISSASAVGHLGPAIVTYRPITGNGVNSATLYTYEEAYPISTTGLDIYVAPANEVLPVTTLNLVTGSPSGSWTTITTYTQSHYEGLLGQDIIVHNVTPWNSTTAYVTFNIDMISGANELLYTYNDEYHVGTTGQNIVISCSPPGAPTTSMVPITGDPISGSSAYIFEYIDAYIVTSMSGVPGSTATIYTPIQITDVEAGDYHVLALDIEGNVYSWGQNIYGQLGTNDYTNRVSPQKVITSNNVPGFKVAAIAAGASHSLALKDTNELFVTGNNNYGQLGNPNYGKIASFIKIMDDVVRISTTNFHNIVVKNEGGATHVWGWGSNKNKQLSQTNIAEKIYIPIRISLMETIVPENILNITATDTGTIIQTDLDGTFSLGV